MRRITLALLLAVMALPFLAPPCWACKCAPLPPRAQARSADVIFTGTVLATNTNADVTIARLAVEQSFKGSGADTLTVRTPTSTAACGVPLRVGASYTVFGTARASGVETNTCTGTVRGEIEPSRFGMDPGQPAGPGNGAPQPSGEHAGQSRPTSGSPPLWSMVAAAVVVGGGALWLRRRWGTSARRGAEGRPPA